MWLVVAAVVLRTVSALRLDECESTALGMESGAISDSQITASSSFDGQSVGPQNARIRTEIASGAWCPKPQIHSSSYEFLQVNLENTYIVTAIETQGRYGNGTGREFVSEYMIDYLRPGSKWIRYRNRSGHVLMTGNYDTTMTVRRMLDPPLVASRLRIVPYSKQMRTICLRMELHGCLHKNGLLFYSTLPGGSRVGDVDFRDQIFENSDLYTETGIKRGLGLLSDGYVSDYSPFDERNPNGSWIGWSRHHTDGIITLLFEFDQLRNFSEILLAAYGRLNSIDVIFSQDGTNFSLSSQISSLSRQPVDSTQKRNDLRIPLHKRIAKKIRVTLSFAADWLFLTEIHFSSVIFNELSGHVDVQDDSYLRKGALGFIVPSSLLLLLAIILCMVIFLRRQKSDKKLKTYEHDIRRNLITTHVDGKTSTEVLPSSQPQLLNFYASDKTTSTSLSSKSASPKFGPATWNDFHFPPPPSSASDETVYAHEDFTPPSLRIHGNEIEHVRSSVERTPQDDDDHLYDTVAAREHGEKVIRVASSSLRISKELGRGKYTVIRECIAPNFGKVAHKTMIDKGNVYGRNAILYELEMLSLTSNPHVIRLHAIDDKNGLLLELAPNGNIREFLKSHPSVIPISKLLGFCADVCEGMRHLESLGIVHGHLTPSNIVVDKNMRAKVTSPRGSPPYAQVRYSAPESILQRSFTSRSDVWAFGVCCWEIVGTSCEKLPFETLSTYSIVENAQKILSGRDDAILLTFTDCVPRGIRDVLQRCFDVEPQLRPPFAHISYFMSKYYAHLDER